MTFLQHMLCNFTLRVIKQTKCGVLQIYWQQPCCLIAELLRLRAPDQNC